MQQPAFHPAMITLPQEEVDLAKWAVLACDQFTSEPEYWQQVEQQVGDAPSTFRITLPEVYLEDKNVQQRIDVIHNKMELYSQNILRNSLCGYVYTERKMQNGSIRQGLVGCVDLEDYSYEKGAPCRIRPSENTVVERIPPRLAVRKGATLETPHILMLLDDPAETVIEPLAGKKQELPLLYDVELMLDGGNLRGWAVTEEADIQAIAKALLLLDDETAFYEKYTAPAEITPFAFIVGDGNHSLATAKAWWEECKKTLPAAELMNHPARYCLVELENVQSKAIEIEPIHRVVFGADAKELAEFALQFAKENDVVLQKQAAKGDLQAVWKNGKQAYTLQGGQWPLTVGAVDAFLESYCAGHPQASVDYVHGDESVQKMANEGAVGILLPPMEKSDLFRGVALGGVLPKKTFSMGHAEEKRYYMECRRITP